MDDGYISVSDLIPGLPSDYQGPVKQTWSEIFDVTSEGAQRFLKAAGDLGKVKGDPAKLDGGVQILNVDVAGAISQARGAIERGNASFTTAWIGRGAEAFANYVPILTDAITAVELSATTTAEAVALFRQALFQLWMDIINKTIELGIKVINAINSAPGDDDKKKKKNAGGSVLALIEIFVGYAAGIVEALLTLDKEKFLAFDKLRLAEKMPNKLVDTGGGPTDPKAAQHYMGPTGVQLPMPNATAADPAWNATEIKDRWLPKSKHSPAFSATEGGRGVAVDTGMMQELINVFRANGTYWDKALNHQIKAMLNHFTPDAFGFAGKDFHAKLQKVLTRDYILYLHSDERMDALGGLLDKINEAYGAEDKQSSRVLSEYLTNGPVL